MDNKSENRVQEITDVKELAQFAQEAKDTGNKHYGNAEYDKAIEYYTKAIDLMEQDSSSQETQNKENEVEVKEETKESESKNQVR